MGSRGRENCKLCGDSFENEFNLLLHFAKIHADPDWEEDLEGDGDGDEDAIKKSTTVVKREEPEDDNASLMETTGHSDTELNKVKNDEAGADPSPVQSPVVRRRQATRNKGPKSTLPRFQCIFCEKWMTRNCELTYHIRSHINEKPYFCHLCDQSFGRPNYFTKHIKMHSGGTERKRYECPICGKSFGQPFRLKEHSLVHSGLRPFKCKQCDKEYTSGENLKRHMRSHTGERPYVCPYCEEGFSTPGTLKVHIRTHSLEKPFKCPDCGSSFRQQHHLKDHMRTHTGERPHPCPFCAKRFSKPASLKYHLKTAHKDRE